MAMLPQKHRLFPDFSEFDLCVATAAFQATGFHDAFLLGEDTLCFAVGNISGNEGDAAFTTTVLGTSLRAASADASSPAEVMLRAKRELCRRNAPWGSITLFLGMLDLRTGEIRYVNRGYTPPLLVRHPGVGEFLSRGGGMAVGALATVEFQSGTVRLESADGIVLFSAGVSEAPAEEGESYAEDRLKDVVRRYWPGRLATMVDAVLSDLQTFSGQGTDTTLLALRFDGNGGPEGDSRRLELSLTGELPELTKVHEACQRFAEHHGLDDSTTAKIVLAIEELFTNAATHGLQSLATEACIAVCIMRDTESVIITVEDTGRPFDPTQAPMPDVTASLEDCSVGGLGLHLVLSVMDDVAYEAVEQRNVVRMRKWIH